MEPGTQSAQQAPPVVAVVVVHEPGPWFEETLDTLSAQDYPNIRFLFLVTGEDATVDARIKVRIPDAFVRSLGANPGFGPSINEVLHLVEGDNGFFLLCHDDIAPEPDAVRVMVEELYRSNAGVVGPKLVEWDDPSVLQAVGLRLDRFGEIDQEIELGEVDQEQHDGVRDVFVLPSAFMLVRADLFRELGGFDPGIDFHGDDVEFCWRVHHSGARVVVVPSARVRHRGALPERRPDLNHRVIAARHRMRAVATMTGPTRLPGRSVELVLLTLVELVVGLFTGKFGQAWASLRALVGLVPRTFALLRRRKAVKPLRHVPEREVHGLQARGSARLNSFLRSREVATYVAADTSVRRWRQSTTAPVVAWLGVIAAVVVGSRSFFSSGVPAVGEFLRFPESPRLLLDSYTSGFNPTGAGSTAANPTGWATLAAMSTATLFRMGLLHTVFIVGLVLVGVGGMWKLATVFPSTRARVAALIVYAASPLVGGALSSGRLTVLVAYASTPWVIHTLRRAVGLETADPRLATSDIADGTIDLPWSERLRRTLLAAIAIALATAFAPIMLPVALLLGVLLAAGTLLALASWRIAVQYLIATAGAVAGAALLNFPWITEWSWDGLVGPPPVGNPGRGLLELASFEIGVVDFAALSLALYVPVVGAIALARAWRLTWAVRAGTIVLAFGALAVLADRDSLPFRGPEAGVLLAPVAMGVAIAGGAALAAFDLDVRGGSFGWRQPLGLLCSVAVVVGIAPGVAAIGDGGWKTPTTPLARLIDASLPDDDDAGYNVLLIGDPRLLPVPSHEYRGGLAWAVIDDGPLDVRDRWMPPANSASDGIELALDEMASSSTLRAGRLLAPLGIRFVVVPEFDGVLSTTDDPLPLPGGLIDELENQLDLVSVTGLPTIEVFENRAWLPRTGILTGETASASRTAGAEALVRADLSLVTPAFAGVDHLEAVTDEVEPGVVHLAIPFDDQWRLDVGGESIEPRRAFGLTTAFDVERSGTAELSYETPSSRTALLVLQTALWLLALFAVTRVTVPLARRRGPLVTDETLIDLDDPLDPIDADMDAPYEPAIFDPGLDVTGPVPRAMPVDAPDDERDDDMPDDDGPDDDGEVDLAALAMPPTDAEEQQ